MIIVYDADLKNFHEITHAVSIQFNELYNGIGKLTMVLTIDAYNVSVIQKNGILYDTVRDMAFTIQRYQYDTVKNVITVNGYTCNWLLNKRVLADKRTFENVENGVYDAVRDNLRGLPDVLISWVRNGYGETSESEHYGNQLLDEMMLVLEEAKLGHRLRWDPEIRKLIFEVYKGRDLTDGIHAVIFSEQYGTAENLVITIDNTTLKNVIYVTGKYNERDFGGEDEEVEITEIVGDYNGGDRYEYWDGGSIGLETKEDGTKETVEELRAKMIAAGNEAAAERKEGQTFSVNIDPSEYGTMYRLGDIVSCTTAKFGMTLKSRITGVSYTLDVNGEKVSLTLGEPILTVMGEVKKRNGN